MRFARYLSFLLGAPRRSAGSRVLNAHRFTVLLLGVLTGCAGLIGVPDITFDEHAEAGSQGDGSSSSSSSGSLGTDGSSGGDAPVTTDGPPVSCNADLKTDKANCGACGHDCTNGFCTDGLCTLMDQTGGAQALALQGDTLYIGFEGELTFAGVASCPTNGCASATVAAKHITQEDAGYIEVESVAVNATHVYASDYYGFGTGAFVRMPLTGGLPTRLGTRSYGLALDSTTIYWTEPESSGSVWYCPIPDCAGGPKLIKDQLYYPNKIVVANDGAVIFEANQTITKCTSKTKCTGADTVDVPKHPGYVNDMAIDGNGTLYWANRDEVLSCSLSPLCANATTVVPAGNSEIVTAVAVSGTSLYWSTLVLNDGGASFDNTAGTVRTCTVGNCTGAGVKVIATKQKAPSAIVLDSKSVYWANNGKYGYTDGIGSVMKAPR